MSSHWLLCVCWASSLYFEVYEVDRVVGGYEDSLHLFWENSVITPLPILSNHWQYPLIMKNVRVVNLLSNHVLNLINCRWILLRENTALSAKFKHAIFENQGQNNIAVNTIWNLDLSVRTVICQIIRKKTHFISSIERIKRILKIHVFENKRLSFI